MHELALAENLLGQVLAVAKEHHLQKVLEVDVEAGVLKYVVPEIMESSFALLAEGTAADGAKLKITPVQGQAQCRACEKIFEPKISDFLCPNCRKADIRIILGQDILLKSIVGE